MPSNFKYRIKHASVSDNSLYNRELIPEEAYQQLEDSGYLSTSDTNIKPHTCTFIQKIAYNNSWYYLCGIKPLSTRSDLITSTTSKLSSSPDTRDGSLQGRVSGAIETGFDTDTEIGKNYFKCQYCDMSTGKATERTIGGQGENIVEFPMCNCYSPRGGLQISVFDGAVKGGLAPGFTYPYPSAENPTILPTVGDAYSKYGKSTGISPPPDFVGAVPPYVSTALQNKHKQRPTSLSMLHLLLNARATVVPCCWWKRASILTYEPGHFRVIDLAVAQKYVESRIPDWSGKLPNMSNILGVSDLADYTAIVGDYFAAGDQLFGADGSLYSITEEDAYILNSMLGRNYDYTLPNTSNNRRFIYVLDSAITGLPTKKIRSSDSGESPSCPTVWHFDTEGWFSPANCGYPDCNVRYTWGHLCNGGGSFSLDEGKACPYYENPLMGDKDSKRFAKLQNMYPGDSINAAMVLELMWYCKGGLPWSKEEWNDTWLHPYIWTTLPFSPVAYQTDRFTTDAGNVVTVPMHTEHHLYSRKAEVDPATGEITLKPPRVLPGGSVSAYVRKQDATLEDGVKVPDVPTLVNKLELHTAASIKILWPTADINTYELSITAASDYAEQIKEAKNKTYNKVLWGKDGLKTLVMGNASRSGNQGVYCINTAFLQGGDWQGKRVQLENKLKNIDYATTETQKLLRDLWEDVIRADVGGSVALKNANMMKTYPDDYGLFVFQDVPLNLLDNPNCIIVFSFSESGTIDVDFVLVKPIFWRGYTYQKDTSLMTSWKTVWNGRPSLFMQESHLNTIRPTLDKGRIQKSAGTMSLSTSKTTSTTATSTSTVQTLYTQITATVSEAQTLISNLSATQDVTTRALITQQLTTKTNEVTSAFKEAATEEEAIYTNKLSLVTTATEKQSLITELTNRISDVNRNIATATYFVSIYSQSGKSSSAVLYGKVLSGWNSIKAVLNSKLSSTQSLSTDTTVTDTSKTDEKLVRYSYKDTSKDAKKGDTDVQENGVIVTVDDYDPEEGTDPVSRLYVPYLSNYRPNHRNIDSYKNVNKLPNIETENITLDIPEDSGLATWGHITVAQNETPGISLPAYSFPSKAAKKIVIYSTRELDKPSSKAVDEPSGVELTSKIGSWYKFPSCLSTVVFVLNPDIFNNFTEAMIFSITALVTYKYKDANGDEQQSTKTVKFLPIDYNQVSRSYPGYTEGKTTRNLGVEEVDGVNYTKIEISEDIAILEKSETGRHPWVFFGIPVSEDTQVKEWRFYSGSFYPEAINLSTVVIPTPKEEGDIKFYIEYAYIGEIYDENAAEIYEWEDEELQTRILFGHPRTGILKTVFKYESVTDKVDDFEAVPIGSHSMATIWPHARIAMRDYEITYIWRDSYKGEEITTGNLTNRTATNWAASRVANKTAGQDKYYSQMCLGDHDLGTEFQPKISYNTKTSTNTTAGIRFKTTRAEWSSTFTDKTSSYLTNQTPTYGFPSTYLTSFIPPDPASSAASAGALYYPYTRSEPSSVFIPRHKTYLWEFLDKWRNKLNKTYSMFGCFRLQATDWCVRGTDTTRVRTWKRHWMYDPDRETQFIGRSKTRGPTFQLEYREYFEMATKTVYLRPYVARTGGDAENCYCASCNRYFKKTDGIECQDCTCPYSDCAKDVKPTDVTNWNAHYTTMLEKIESDTTEEVTETLSTTEEETFVPKNPDRTDYNTWKARMTTLYNAWLSSGKNSGLLSMQREQARGRRLGWYANIYGDIGIEFVTDTTTTEETTTTSGSEVDITTGCDKFGTTKRMDLGAFQISDGYVPGSVDPYYGTDSSSSSETEYYTLEAEATAAESAAATAKADTDRYTQKEKSMTGNDSYTENGTVYTLEGQSTYTSGGAATTKLSDKIAEAQKIQDEKEAEAENKRAKVKALNSKTARGQAREDIAAKAKAKKEEVEKKCNRYYSYLQQSYGYNYPWSPFDSPPVFGNTGREMYIVEICTIGSVISWLPRPVDKDMQMPVAKTTYTSPAIPSWWTARIPEGAAKELVTLLVPPVECTRAVTALHSEAQNPMYNYIFDSPFSETAATIGDSAFKTVKVRDIRIATRYNPDYSGQPYYRSDAGRFVLIPRADTKLCDIYVTKDTPLYKDETQDEFGEVTSFAGTITTTTTNTATSDSYINGDEIKGFSIKARGTTFVGDYYPGFEGPYSYGKSFIGFRGVTGVGAGTNIHWAWPELTRDWLYRAKKLVKYYPDLLPPLNVDGTIDTSVKYLITEKENDGIWAIPTVECGPYLKKADSVDDGREISGGPTLTEGPVSDTSNKEKTFLSSYFCIVVESERSHDGRVRSPLIWVEKIDSSDLTSVQEFKVPSDDAQPHRITSAGELIPVAIAAGDEGITDSLGNPSYKDAFSSGTITDIDNMENPSRGANLFTSKDVNESGYWPGFKVGNINYKTIGKVFNEKSVEQTLLDRTRVIKTISANGQNNHTLVAQVVYPYFNANATFIKLYLNSFFDDLSSYLTGTNDSVALKVEVYGTPVPGSFSSATKYSASYLLKLPVEDTSSPITLDVDFDITSDLYVTITFLVVTAADNFYTGPWKGVEFTYEQQELPYYENGTYVGTKLQTVQVQLSENYCYLSTLVASMKLGVLSPGKCAEVVRVEEAEFFVTTGELSERKSDTYNLFTEATSESYKCNWEEYDKTLDETSGWWEDSGRVEASDSSGVDEQWAVSAEKTMIENWRSIEGEGSQIGKEQKASVFPKACAEIPELPVSRLKMNTWTRLNSNQIPTVKNVQTMDLSDASINSSWVLGGVWSTRVAGPEWVTGDEFPSRDIIWWPAPVFNEGKLIMKGRAWQYGSLYKDEAKVISKNKRREIEDGDTYNENAYKYEIRGFEALLQKIQNVEQTGAEERKSASYQRTYGKTYANNYNQIQSVLNGASSNTNTSDSYIGQISSDYSTINDQANLSLQGLANSIASNRNYTITDKRTWVTLSDSTLDVDAVTWQNIKEREEMQAQLFEEDIASLKTKLNLQNGSLSFTAIIPYHDWHDLCDLTGRSLVSDFGFVSRGFTPLQFDALEKDTRDCQMRWKMWDWDEIQSFTFRSEYNDRYPNNAPTGGSDWSSILVRKCGTRWVHKDTELDGGQVWDNYDEHWKTVVNSWRAARRKQHPIITITDCKKIEGEEKNCIKETQDVADNTKAGVEDSAGSLTTDRSLSQKWTASKATDYPPTVSSDKGKTFNYVDPWWRY